MNTDVPKLLRIIKYSPLFIIIIACFSVIILMYQEQEREFEKEKHFTETEYINIEKKRIVGIINTVEHYIENEKKLSEKTLKEDLKNRIDIVHKIATNIYIKNKDKYSKNEIIEQIKNAIQTIRFNEGREYFSIHTMEGINILHPINPKFEGTSVLNRKDSRGNYPVQKVINIAKTKGEGFASWYYFKPNDKSKEFKKIGIVKKFEPYNFVITTAEYVNEYNENLKERILNNISKLRYKNGGFIFIINNEGKVLLHKSKKVLNHNIFKDDRFLHVRAFFSKLFLNEDKKAGDFIFTKPSITHGENTKEQKITYVKKIDTWNWVIATSFKLSELNQLIEKKKIILEEEYSFYKKEVLFFGLFFTITLLLISFFIAKLIEKKFLEYKESLEKQILENRKQKEALLTAQKIAHIGDWKLNIKSNEASWSDEFIQIFGVSNINKEIFGPEYIKTLIFEEDLSLFENTLNTCIETGKEYNCIYRIRRPDGEVKWISSRGQIDKDKLFMHGTAQDITAIKKLELEKKEKEKIIYQQNKLAAMGEMLGNIAHQWRQPLSVISTASTGAKLQKEMDILSDKEFNNTMDSINESAQYLSQTIEDFRGFFDPNNNVVNKFNIEDAVSKTLKLLSTQFTIKDIEIIKDIEKYELQSVENELIQVLINLLNNAKDVLLTKEDIKRLIFINTYKKENMFYIEIIDNAGGIKDDIIDRIFEPYFTTKHQSQGTGIGLYMSEEIIKNHLNGVITVENTSYVYDKIEYNGAKFIIKINITKG